MTESPSPSTRVITRDVPNRFLWAILGSAFLAYVLFFTIQPRLLSAVGVYYLEFWFLDSFAVLASNDALRRGLDVYADNPLDVLGRPHVYSWWWLQLHRFGLTRADNFWVGLSWCTAFFATALAVLRPRSPGETLWFGAVLCSSAVLLAVHRANNDLVIFVLLAPIVPCLLSGSTLGRVGAAGLIALAAGLKFYPAAAILLLLIPGAGKRQRVLPGLTFALLLLLAVGFSLRTDLTRMGATLSHTKAEGLMTFGAGNIVAQFGLSGWVALAVTAGLGLLIVGILFRWRPTGEWTPSPSEQSDWLYFVLGAALLTGCFFTGRNFAYRWIFGLWMAPFLWRTIQRASTPLRVRRYARLTAFLFILALWADPLASLLLTQALGKISGVTLTRWIELFFAIEQPFTWALFICLLGWLVHFVRAEVPPLFRLRA